MLLRSVSRWRRFLPIILFICTWYTSGQSIFGFARDFLQNADGFVKGISYGIKKVKQGLETVEGILKESEDKKCEFKCPNGSPPKKKQDYKPVPDGCGSYGIHLTGEDLPHKDMIECCNDHDICYGTCQANKDHCDTKFFKCLDSVCHKKSKKDKLPNCKLAAHALHAGCQTLGCKAYKDTQGKACTCGKTEL